MTAGIIASGRLAQERKKWRKDHPVGFYAKPASAGDGSANLFCWDCKISGKEGTDWEGGLYSLRIFFLMDYPNSGPKVAFAPHFFHPNVYPSGDVCLSILNNWSPETSLKQILIGVRDLLDNPNNASAANHAAFESYKKANKAEYNKKVREQALRYRPVDDF